ncbi:MAG: LysM peptidoglycan-binding domain-containing protein, partial [Anaerolineae bacterium]
MHKPTIAKAILTAFLAALLFLSSVNAQEPAPTEEPSATPSGPRFTAEELIDVVNRLRVESGIAALTIHPVLMEVAQMEANGLASGAAGHWRPENMSLGMWLLSLGYPLSGDLSMDGYRSENWFSTDISSELSEVTQGWQADPEHLDTMYSQYRSDIGAALAVGDDGQVYVVLETALRTPSGKMQYDALVILTGIPQTQTAYNELATQAALNGVPIQYSMPVVLSTARADGTVVHEVRYGQTLWGIALAYHTTIKQIQALNHMASTTVYDGQKLVVMQGATQPAPGAKPAPTWAPAPTMLWTPAPAQAEMPTQPAAQPDEQSPQDSRTGALSFGAIALAGLVLAGVFTAMFRKRGETIADNGD